MSTAGPSETDYLQASQHRKESSAGSRLSRAGTPLRHVEDDRASEYYDEGDGDDVDDVFDDYYENHQRLPSEPARLNLDLPESNLDLTMTFDSILAEAEKQETDRVQKRASNVMKLTEQNEKLKEELRAMTERLEAAERMQKDLESRAQRRSTEGGAGSAH